MKAFISIAFVAFLVAACGPTAEKSGSDGETAAARMVDGTQVIAVTAGQQGFAPSRIELKAGVPARLVFKRTSKASCAETVSVPEFGVEKKALPVGEEVAVEFTPNEAGEFTFVCGMDMMEGTLVVSS